jgi:small-conductance mechanosensitive channel
MIETIWDAVSDGHPWAATGLELAVALAASLLIFRGIRMLLAMGVWIQPTLFGVIWSRANHALQLVLPFLSAEVVLDFAPDSLTGIETWRRLAMVVLIASITVSAVQIVSALGDWIIRHHRLDVADNLTARRIHTQTRVLTRAINTGLLLFGLSAALMTFPSVRHLGMSLLASAGVAGLVIGLAARSVLGNLLAGLQIALTQPLRLDDVVVISGYWGRVEDISSAYVTVRVWDERRLILPLEWLTQNPFENWTRTSSALLGTVLLWVDFGTPLEALRAELDRLAHAAPEWDQRVCKLQVTDADERSMQIRALVSASDSSKAWDLRCRIREGLIAFLQREYPQSLPRLRLEGPLAAAP